MQNRIIQSCFDFPNAEDRVRLKRIGSEQCLRKYLLDLKKSSQYKDHDIKYTMRCWERCNSPVEHLSVYFTCCKLTNLRPSIHFSRRDGEKFVLESRSTYTHCHFVKKKAKITTNTESYFQPPNETGLDSLNMSRKIGIKKRRVNKKNSYKKVNQQQEIERLLQEEEESSSHSDSWQVKEQMERADSIPLIKKEIFDFPTLDLLQKIKTINSMSALTSKFNHCIRLRRLEYFGIRYSENIHEKINQNGERVKTLTVQFKCCSTKNECQIPYLTFIQQESGTFNIQDYYIRHDHRFTGKKGRSKKSITKISNHQLKQINLVDHQQLLSFVAKLRDHPHDQLLMDDEEERNDEEGNGRSADLRKYQHQYKLVLKKSEAPQNNLASQSIHIKQTNHKLTPLPETIQKGTQKIVKPHSTPQQGKLSYWISAFTKKEKPLSMVIIQISSQSQNN